MKSSAFLGRNSTHSLRKTILQADQIPGDGHLIQCRTVRSTENGLDTITGVWEMQIRVGLGLCVCVDGWRLESAESVDEIQLQVVRSIDWRG